MPSMFPGMYASPDDPNRGPRRATGPESDVWPTSLRWGYYLTVGAAVLMVLTGMVSLTQGYGPDPGAAREVIDAFHRNIRFIGVYNILAGLLIAALGAQLKSGGRISRRVLAVVFALSVFFNLAAFAIQVGGLGMVAICVLLGVAAVLLFRPESNTWMKRAGDPTG